jgi:hypothetical protein
MESKKANGKYMSDSRAAGGTLWKMVSLPCKDTKCWVFRYYLRSYNEKIVE